LEGFEGKAENVQREEVKTVEDYIDSIKRKK